MAFIKQRQIWEVSNAQETARREVVVVSNHETSRNARWHQVIPLDEVNSGRKHPFDVRVRGKNVAIDLITTLPEQFFITQKESITSSEFEEIRTALFQLFSPV
ncbi:MAG: type II toxin-antitoxin system PemK/MazF family toxin [Bacteroidota bacterium]